MLALCGELDFSNSASVTAAVEALQHAGHRRLRLDLESVTFIDASAVRSFLEARGRGRAQGGEVILCRVEGLPLRVFALLGLDTELIEDVRA